MSSSAGPTVSLDVLLMASLLADTSPSSAPASSTDAIARLRPSPYARNTQVYARKSDANAPEIVAALRKCGVQVFDMGRTAAFLAGFPDLLAVVMGEMFLIEVKAEKGTLTEDQIEFHGVWQGPPIAILRSADEAAAWARMTRRRLMEAL